MNTLSITPERLGLALNQIKPTDGALWEVFANSFLASEFPQLRPVGGIHDAGRDAFLYEPDGEPGIYIQHSTQETFERKIRDTLDALKKMVLHQNNSSIVPRAISSKIRMKLNENFD